MLLIVPLLAATQLSSSAPEALAGRDPGRGVDQPPWNGNGIGVDTGRVVEIRSAGIELAFDVTEIEATAGETLTIRFINASDMAHNVVLLKAAEDIQLVGEASWRAHANDWVPEGEIDRIVAHTAVAGPGEEVEVTFTVPPPGTYPFICTYSGHWTTMQGRLISTEPDEMMRTLSVGVGLLTLVGFRHNSIDTSAGPRGSERLRRDAMDRLVDQLVELGAIGGL